MAQAWPRAPRADLPGSLSDGPLFSPTLFVTASKALGTAPSPDATALRLILHNTDGGIRELRRLPSAADPQFDTFTMAGDDIAWTESTRQRPPQIWTVNLRDSKPAHRLTDDTGNQSGTTMLRNLHTGRNVVVAATGADPTTCSPAWCRVMVTGGEGLIRVDLMRPDGTTRRRIGGGNTQIAVTDVAVLDRFEILSEPGPDTDLTGTASLLVYDIRTGRTVVVSPAADGAFTRGGLLWWSTGDADTTTWHSLDLRGA